MNHLSRPTPRRRNLKLRAATTNDVKVLESQLALREIERNELSERLTALIGAEAATSLLRGKGVDLEIDSPDKAEAVKVLMPRVARFVRGG